MTHYQLVEQNKQRSAIVVVGFMLFVVVATWLMTYTFGYDPGLVGVALLFSGVVSFGSYWFSDSVVLAVSKARPVTREEFFDFYTVTENLCMSLQLPVPKLYVIDDTAMNAFSTGAIQSTRRSSQPQDCYPDSIVQKSRAWWHTNRLTSPITTSYWCRSSAS